jgi:hypothetical protein
MVGGFLVFISEALGTSTAGVLIGWLIVALAWPLWWLLNGVGTLVLRGGSFPKELLVGKREFVKGRKAVVAGLSRMAIGAALLTVPISAIDMLMEIVLAIGKVD